MGSALQELGCKAEWPWPPWDRRREATVAIDVDRYPHKLHPAVVTRSDYSQLYPDYVTVPVKCGLAYHLVQLTRQQKLLLCAGGVITPGASVGIHECARNLRIVGYRRICHDSPLIAFMGSRVNVNSSRVSF